jgi:ADP-heptose:LPS heptosyltransferase
MKDFAININHEELKLGNEIPTLLKLRLKKTFKKESRSKGKILIVDTCIIGDFLASLPALRTFIKNSGQRVDLLVSPPLKSIARSIKGVDRVFTGRSVWARAIERVDEADIISGEYAHVQVLRISPDTYKMLENIKYSSIAIYDIPYFKYVAHLLKSVLLKTEPKQWRDASYEMIGIKKPVKHPGFEDIFEFTGKEYAEAAALPELGGSAKKVIIHTGSGWNIKLWDNRKWTELIKKINAHGDFRFLFIGGGAFEEASFTQIQKGLDFKIHSLINRTDLKTCLLTMRLCDYFIGIDSGPRNMAHLADLRSITLLGPAPNNFKPVNPEDIVINKFDCRCKSLFYLHKVSAIHKISSEEVFAAFKRLPGAFSSKPDIPGRAAIDAGQAV